MNAYFNNLYQDLLGNAAISGLTLQVHWDTVNPSPPTAAKPCDWSYVDDAFNHCTQRIRSAVNDRIGIEPTP